MFKLAKHGPAEHVGQEDVERDRRRLELLGELQRLRAARGDQDFEAPVPGEIDQHPRIMRVVFNDQKNGVSRLEIEPVVRQLFDDPFLRHDLKYRRRAIRRGRCDSRRDRRA